MDLPSAVLTGDELTEALLPLLEELVAAVHDLDRERVDAVFAAAEQLVGDPVATARHLAVLTAAMASEDHSVTAALGWTLNPEEYRELRATTDALTASLRAARADPRGAAA